MYTCMINVLQHITLTSIKSRNKEEQIAVGVRTQKLTFDFKILRINESLKANRTRKSVRS